MPLMIKLNRNIMKVDLCLDNGHFITVIIMTDTILAQSKPVKKDASASFFGYLVVSRLMNV